MAEEQMFFLYLCSFLHVLRCRVKSSSQVQGMIQLNSMEGVNTWFPKTRTTLACLSGVGGEGEGSYSSRLFIYSNLFFKAPPTPPKIETKQASA